MNKSKLFYSTKTRELIANAYASQILSDVWEKLSEGFECKTIAEFYKECSNKELIEVTNWTHYVFGKNICDLVDKAIDEAILTEETEIANVRWIFISEAFSSPGDFHAVLVLDDPDHKEKNLIHERNKKMAHYL
jgi:hypothetical protein